MTPLEARARIAEDFRASFPTLREARMRGRTSRKRIQSDPLQILRGGKAVPTELVRHCIADLQHKRKTELEQRHATERRMARLFDQARGAVKPGVKERNKTRSLDALLGIHTRFAKQKLLVPKAVGGLGGLLPGQITVTVVPPFDYEVIIPTRLAGNDATLAAAADRRTGAMNVSAITATERGFNGGSMYTTVGLYFHPLAAGTLTLHARPKYSFQWWTNSLQAGDLVRSFGSGGLTIYGVDVAAQTTGGVGTIVSTAGTTFKLWDENQTAQVRFDFGFDQEAPSSVSLEVSHNLVYLLFVEADVHVEGVGWPGSLAGAKLAVSVSSLTYDFQAQQVFQT